MKRTKTKTPQTPPDAIITADIHLAESAPVSRTDDYLAAQAKKLHYLNGYQQQYGCPVIDAGDIFNHWKPSPWLLSRAYHLLPDDMITIPGNHDLPEHSLSLYHKSGLAVLDAVEKLRVIEDFEYVTANIHAYGFAYGAVVEKEAIDMYTTEKADRRILVLHLMVWPDRKPPWPGAEGIPAIDLLEEFHDTFDLIVTGHHHVGFTVSHKSGALLVNPGPMMRISADKADYKPRFYLYYAEDNSVEPVYYPIEANVHDDRHLTEPKERDARLSAYIERMNMEWESGLSFQANLEAFFQRNKTPKKVRELIWQSLEE